LHYLPKQTNEYQDPHSTSIDARSEPNAYQDSYSTYYLDSVKTYNDSHQLYNTQLNYAFLGLDAATKRLLTEVTYTTPEGSEQAPPQRFSYWGQEDSDGVKGLWENLGISTCEELQAIGRDALARHYVLTTNIDCSATKNWNGGKGFAPIGGEDHPFTGTMLGNGYSIYNLTINRPDESFTGLFGYTMDAEISYIGILSATIVGHKSVGTLVGQNNSTAINRAYIHKSVSLTGDDNVGGLVGKVRTSSITNAYSAASVNGQSHTGGLIGEFDGQSDTKVTGSYYDMQVSQQDDDAGKGIPESTQDMMEESTYKNWDFVNTWGMREGKDYPLLRPQIYETTGWQYDLFNVKTEALYGALKTTTLPQGGEITYYYDQQDITSSNRKLHITKPSGNWTNPKTFWGSDYVVVVWQGDNSNQIHVTAYQWVGYWKAWKLPDTGSGKGILPASTPADIAVEVQADFFALTTSNGVSLFHKDMLMPGKWQQQNINRGPLVLNYIQVASGERFFVVLNELLHRVYLFTWTGQNFTEHSIELLKDHTVFGLTARNNYFFTASADPLNASEPELRLYHLSSQGSWQEHQQRVASKFFISGSDLLKSYTSASIDLTSGNTFVTLQAASQATTTIGVATPTREELYKHYIFSWSENFEMSTQQLPSIRDSYRPEIHNAPLAPVLTTDGNNLVTLADQEELWLVGSHDRKDKKYTYRFNGVDWLTDTFTNDNLANNYWGFDSISTTSDGTAQYREFNPNAADWEKHGPKYEDGNPTRFQKVWPIFSNIEAVGSFVLSPVPIVGEVMMAMDLLTLIGDIQSASLMEGSRLSGLGRYFIGKDTVYYKRVDGTWKELGRLTRYVDERCISAGCNNIVERLEQQSTQSASTFLAYLISREESTHSRKRVYFSKIQLLKNGEFFGKAINLPEDESLRNDASNFSLVGDRGFISYVPSDSSNPKLKYATSLYLYRVAANNFTNIVNTQDQLQNNLKDFTVSRVQVNTGSSSIYTHYEYNEDTGLIALSGSNALYNQVTVTPSGSSETLDKSNGFTMHYFLNGNPDLTAGGDGTQAPFLTSDTVQKCVFNEGTPDCSSATDSHLSSVRGLEYYTQVCEQGSGDCQEVANTRQKFQVFSVPLDTQQFQSVFTRPWQSSSSVDGSDDLSTTTTYNPEGFPSSSSSTQYNLEGTEQTSTTQYTYIQDAYTGTTDKQQLQQLNLLSPVVQSITKVNGVQVSENVTTWKDWGGAKWAFFQNYSANNNQPGSFDWSNNNPATAKNWIKTAEVTERNSDNGVVTETLNVDGVYQSVIYDSQYRFPVATFAAARTSTQQAGYYGFEVYEDQGTWVLSGAVGQSLTHSGKNALIGNDDISIHPATFSPVDSSTAYIVSAWVKPQAGQTCGLGFGSIQVDSSNHANWQYLEAVTTQPNSNQKPLVKCPNGGHIDDVRYGPVAAPFSARVYDPSSLLITAKLGTNGEVQRYVYNQQRQLIAVVGPNEQPTSSGATFYSRQGSNDDTYDPSNPNASLSLAARKDGLYFDFEHEGAALWSGGVVSNGALSLSGGDQSRFIGVPAQNAATHLRVMPDANNPSQDIMLSVGKVSIKYKGSNDWELFLNGKSVDTTSADFGQDWLLITVNRAVFFYVNGQQIFNEYLSQAVSGKSLTLRVSGSDDQSTSFADIMVFPHPVISVTYGDGLGNLLQQQSLENDTTVIAAATLYDDLGRAAVATKPIRSTSTPGLLQFQPNLASLDWQTGIMSGSVASYYSDGGDGFSDDEGFPYSRQVFEQNPLSRPIATGLPGKDFAYQPVASFESAIPDTQNITEYDYGPNPDYTDSLFSTLGIEGDNQKRYDLSTQFTPWNTPGHIPTVSMTDLGGQLVGQQTGSGDLTATAGYQYDFDVSGNRQSSVYSPNYYANAKNEIYSSTLSHNVLGQLTSQTTPDNHQTQYQYDDAGRLRFLMNANGATQSPNRVLYWKYDQLGRVIESGYFDQNWSAITESDLQNTASYPSTPDTWRQQYHYDDNELCDTEPQTCSQFLKGRLFSVSINTDQDNDPEATESYKYSPAGRIRTVINTATDYPDDINAISYTYDRLGNVTAIDYGKNPEQANLQNNVIISNDLKGSSAVNALDAIIIAPNVNAADDSTTTLHAGGSIAIAKNFTAYQGAELSAWTGHPHYVALYDYNQLGQLVSIGTSSKPTLYASYSYNANGSINTEKLNNEQLARSYDYNSPGWLSKIQDSYFTQALTYKSDESPQTYDAANISSISYTFENAKYFPDGTAPPDYEYDYSYDTLGRLQSANAVSANDGNIDQYDLGVSKPLGYDLNGNIINLSRGTDTAPDYTYYDGSNNDGSNKTGPNQVKTSTGSALYCYDNNGNMTGRSSDCSDTNAFSQTLSYDPFNQLATEISNHDNGTKVNFTHGMGTKRLTKVVSGGTPSKTLYLHGLGALPLIEKTQSGNDPASTTYYVYGPNGLIASNDTQENYFFSTDHLGSTRVVSKGADSNVQAYYNYMPFGQLMEDNSGGPHKDKFSYRYTGQEYDAETDLYNYRARIYDPALARFYATDPAQESFGPYTYVGNNPIRFTDPTGLIPVNGAEKLAGKAIGKEAEKAVAKGTEKAVANETEEEVRYVRSDKESGIVPGGTNGSSRVFTLEGGQVFNDPVKARSCIVCITRTEGGTLNYLHTMAGVSDHKAIVEHMLEGVDMKEGKVNEGLNVYLIGGNEDMKDESFMHRNAIKDLFVDKKGIPENKINMTHTLLKENGTEARQVTVEPKGITIKNFRGNPGNGYQDIDSHVIEF